MWRNYNPSATEDDGREPAAVAGRHDLCAGRHLTGVVFADDTAGYALEVEWVTAHEGGALDGMSTYRLHVVLNDAADLLSSC